VVIAVLLLGGGMRLARADDATAAARSHYEMGLQLFDAREHEQALIEFARANDLTAEPCSGRQSLTAACSSACDAVV